MIKNFAFIFLFFCSVSLFSQEEFTEEQLIGKSNKQFFGFGYNLQKEADEAFLLMQAEAVISGIDIQIVSSYRSYERQKQIWTRKYNRFTSQGLSPDEAIKKIIEYSTIPGTSRHHWGTDIDIIDGGEPQPKSVLQTEHFDGDGVYVKLKKWMDEHAHKYDFYLVYTDDADRKGFKYEPWHYSYKPISKKMLTEFRKLDIKQILLSDELVGADYFTDEFIHQYVSENVLDINPELKKSK